MRESVGGGENLRPKWKDQNRTGSELTGEVEKNYECSNGYILGALRLINTLHNYPSVIYASLCFGNLAPF